ncbi:MAG: hypothetical protein R3190_13255 [Thermoanaerobaculia bacterium]|nr:hypothetical protein [Thermoanaerobaculia bacterium]
MIRRTTISMVVAAAVCAAATGPAAAQNAEYTPPRNVFGQPDLSGVWSNATTTKFERPSGLENLVLTEEEAAQVQGRAEDYRAAGDTPTPPSAPPPEDGNTALGYNRFWTDPGTQVMRVGGEPRSSMITFPEDGRVPPRREGAPPPPPDPRTLSANYAADAGRDDDPEVRGLPERCIFMPTTAGPVLRPVLYNNNYLITQGEDAVAIQVEMIHDVRIVRLDADHRSDGVRPWMGDSIGWYEGDTLVVETTDYHPHQKFYGASEELQVTERFTRVAEDRLLYQFTVEDPLVWEEPWGGEYEFWASPGIYEYACHEGNHGLYNILAGGRAEERRAARAAAEAEGP